MRFLRVKLLNWRNFKQVDANLERRTFIVGPNAAGKSNLLDAFKFLRDIADPQGGFQPAVLQRGGLSALRSLHARQYSSVAVEVDVGEQTDVPTWSYRIEFRQDKQRRITIAKEIVRRDGETILERPDSEDIADPTRLAQTALEQVNSNKAFRELANFLSRVRYTHLVPQLVRDPGRSVGKSQDPFGGDFLEQLAGTSSKVQKSRLNRIEKAMKIAIPQLQKLELQRDTKGIPHLRGLYSHWRPGAGWQNETQWSDGTLRLLGLLWSFLDGVAPILLEEPELSLHGAVVRHIPALIAQLGRKTNRQYLISTHSADLLSDPSIDATEVLMLTPSGEGTEVKSTASISEISDLLASGQTVAEAVLPRTAPQNADQLSMFGTDRE